MDGNICVGKSNAPLVDRYSYSFAQLKSMPKNDQKKMFFEYWTLKEAYIKARGQGLYLSTADFSYNFGSLETRIILISFTNKIKENPEECQFSLLQPTQQHQRASSIHKGKKSNLRIIQKISSRQLQSNQKIDHQHLVFVRAKICTCHNLLANSELHILLSRVRNHKIKAKVSILFFS